MGNVTQIYGLVNDAMAEALGSHAIRVKDTTSFVSTGKTLSDVELDKWFGALACRISKTVEFVRLFERKNRGIITDYQEFGAFVQKIYTALPSAVSNPSWAASNGQNPPTITRANPYSVTNTITVTSKVFGNIGTWSIEICYGLKQLRQAFLSEASMMAFVNSIYETIENKFTIDVNDLETLAAATGIALCLENSKATNVLDLYNVTFSKALTETTCQRDMDYLAFEAEQITKTAKYMQEPSTIFNAAGYQTATPEDKLIVEVLATYATDAQFALRSNTYHEELVRMPRYNEVAYWQCPGTSYAEADVSAIKIKNSEVAVTTDNPPVAKEIAEAHIVAYLRDEEAVKAYFGERYVWEDFNKRDRVTTHGEQADRGYAVEPHANAWVFYRKFVDHSNDNQSAGGEGAGSGT